MLPAGAAQPRRPTDHHDRSVTGNGDGGSSSGNLTTINLLPPVEAPTGFAALGVPERIDLGLAAAGFAQPFAIQTEAIPVALAGSRRVRPGPRPGPARRWRSASRCSPASPMSAEAERTARLVLVPTRELAIQVAEVLVPVAAKAGMRVLRRLRRRQPAPADRSARPRVSSSSSPRRCA